MVVKQNQIAKGIASITLLVMLFSAGAYSAVYTFPVMRTKFSEYDFSVLRENPVAMLDFAENELHVAIPYRMDLRDIYATLAVLQGKREIRNFFVLKDEMGYLQRGSYYQEPNPDVMVYAKRMRRLRDAVEENGGRVVFVGAPGKSPGVGTAADSGYPFDETSMLDMDKLLTSLYANQVSTIDLRTGLAQAGLPYNELYYRTESTWTVRAAFEAVRIIARDLEAQFGIVMDPDAIYCDPKNYQVITYPEAMMGEFGRTAGIPFGGIDDFHVLLPTFPTHFSRAVSHEDGNSIEGDFETALLEYEYLLLDDRYNNPSAVYFGNNVQQHIVNHDLPNAMTALIIGDANFVPVAAYLATMCSEVTLYTPLASGFRSSGISIDRSIEENDYDLVLVACQASNIRSDMFRFYR